MFTDNKFMAPVMSAVVGEYDRRNRQVRETNGQTFFYKYKDKDNKDKE